MKLVPLQKKVVGGCFPEQRGHFFMKFYSELWLPGGTIKNREVVFVWTLLKFLWAVRAGNDSNWGRSYVESGQPKCMQHWWSQLPGFIRMLNENHNCFSPFRTMYSMIQNECVNKANQLLPQPLTLSAVFHWQSVWVAYFTRAKKWRKWFG